MKKLSATEKDRFEILLTKALDDELAKDERAEFEAFLKKFPQYKQEWEEHTKIKEVTKMMKFKQPSAETWDGYWLRVYNRIERGFAWIAISVGASILLAYGLYHLTGALFTFVASPEAPLFIRIAIVAILAGVSVLFISVIREKFSTRKKDQYKEVQR